MMNNEMMRPISPLQRLYNIEKTLFPNMEKIKSDIDNFEKILIKIYSEKEKNELNWIFCPYCGRSVK